jgi:Na+/H+ antiporter NhaD/arsenite permease-like protein
MERAMSKTPWLGGLLLLFVPLLSFAESGDVTKPLDLTHTWAGYFSLIVVVLAYVFAMFEDVTYLRKSKPMLLGASLVWVAILIVYRQQGDTHLAIQAFRENLLAYMELLLFILVSMTYLNVMEDMNVFDALRLKLVRLNLGYRPLFWITGFLVFFISSVVNGLTSGLLMGAVVVAVGRNSPKFVSLACINIVVACNAGGSFSPLGGISTLFVWQGGVLKFTEFLTLFLPCLANFLVPASIMHFAVPKGRPDVLVEAVDLPRGTKRIIFLFGLTIAFAVIFNMVLGLPPAAGMMAGFALLQFFEYFLMKTSIPHISSEPDLSEDALRDRKRTESYAFFEKTSRLEWDTLLFFYGAMVGIGGLGFIGYLDAVSNWLYGQHSATLANIFIGLSSAFVDNGTLMFAVLNMHPDLPQGQWLLVTLTLGVGGSLLAIGSAPGIGLLGMSKGKYSFADHMKWCPVILLGYFAAIAVHFLVNARFF